MKCREKTWRLTIRNLSNNSLISIKMNTRESDCTPIHFFFKKCIFINVLNHKKNVLWINLLYSYVNIFIGSWYQKFQLFLKTSRLSCTSKAKIKRSMFIRWKSQLFRFYTHCYTGRWNTNNTIIFDFPFDLAAIQDRDLWMPSNNFMKTALSKSENNCLIFNVIWY